MEYSGERFLPEECDGEMAIEHYQRYQFASQFTKGKIVLDAACGEGYGSSMIAKEADKVFGLDINEEVINNANSKYGNNRLSFTTGSIDKLPFDDSCFDVIVSFETIEHVDANVQRTFMKEIRRVLKPEGLLIMSTPNKAVYTDYVLGQNHFHVKEFYVQEYIDFLHERFQNIELFCQFPDTGYFIAKESQPIEMTYVGKTLESSRYVIAVCSNEEIKYSINTNAVASFDDQMYYFLNKSVHLLEKKIFNTKREAEAFQEQEEKAISQQKEYINKLEQDIQTQRDYIVKLEREIPVQQEAVTHLEKDIEEQKKYIAHLEKDIAELKEHIRKKEEQNGKENNV